MWICCGSEKNLVFVFFEKKSAEKEDSLKDEKGSSVSSSTKQVKIVSLRKQISFINNFFLLKFSGESRLQLGRLRRMWRRKQSVAATVTSRRDLCKLFLFCRRKKTQLAFDFRLISLMNGCYRPILTYF